jgi:protein ImuA
MTVLAPMPLRLAPAVRAARSSLRRPHAPGSQPRQAEHIEQPEQHAGVTPPGADGVASRPDPLTLQAKALSQEAAPASETASNLETAPVAWIPADPRLAKLARQLLRNRKHGSAQTVRSSSGFPPLDAALGGGLATGAVHEFIAAQPLAAVRTVALRAAARAVGGHQWLLYLDHNFDFYAPAAAQWGVPLGRLLVVRAESGGDRLWVAEQALRCRAVGAVILAARHLPATVTRRLQLAAEAGGGLGLLLRDQAPREATFAATRLRFETLPTALGARGLRITVLKQRHGPPGATCVLELPDAPGAVPASAATRYPAGAAGRAASG